MQLVSRNRVVTAMAGLDLSRLRLATWTAKKCLPLLPWCGRMWFDRLGGGRPASNRWPTYATHEQTDAPEAATTSSQVENSPPRPR